MNYDFIVKNFHSKYLFFYFSDATEFVCVCACAFMFTCSTTITEITNEFPSGEVHFINERKFYIIESK